MSLPRALELCYYVDQSCVAFDWSGSGGAYFHRVGAECADAAGGTWLNGGSPGNVYYQVKDEYRTGERRVREPRCEHIGSGGFGDAVDTETLAGRVATFVALSLLGTCAVAWAVVRGSGAYYERRAIGELLAMDEIDDPVLELEEPAGGPEEEDDAE